MSTLFSFMLPGHFGQISSAKNQNEFLSSSIPVHLIPYVAGLRSEKLLRCKSEKVLSESWMKLPQTIWKVLLVLRPKKHGSLLLLVLNKMF